MTTTNWVTRVVCVLLALTLLLGSLLAVVEIAAAALDRAPALVPHPEWTRWLRAHSWDDWTVDAALGGLVVLGLLLLLLALRRGKPASLALRGRTDGVDVLASRRSVEKSLAAAAARTSGIVGASASVSRRTARVEARAVARSESGNRDEVETSVTERLESLGLQRRMRTRVGLDHRGPTMNGRPNVINRVVLTVLGLLLLAAGGVGLVLGAGVFGAGRATSPVLPPEVSSFPDGRPWFWWAVVGALLLVAALALLWLVIQLRTDRTSRLDLTASARDGYTTLHASALTDAVEEEALGITGVTGASASVHEHRGQRVFLRVELADSANIAEVRARLEDDVVAHLREGVGDPRFPVTIQLRPVASRTQQRTVI